MHSRGLVFSALFALLNPHVGASVLGPPSTLVKLSYGSFEEKAAENLVEFLGIPFAVPPVGRLRFAPPVPPTPFKGVQQATSFAAACAKQVFENPLFPGPTTPPKTVRTSGTLIQYLVVLIIILGLYLNVIRPAMIPSGRKLPVLVYIYGGGFVIGDTTQVYGNTLVNRSLDLGEPIVYVTAAYRLNAFGFLAGKEVKDAGIGNLGLRDRLFCAAAMESGSPLVLPDILQQQRYFDSVVTDTNCTTAPDKLECLRDAPFEQLVAAVDRTPSLFAYQSLKVAWMPVVDGVVIVRDPLISLQEGKYAKIPFITGTVEDEGTLFSLGNMNITTNAQYLEYMKSNYFPSISDADLAALEVAYPDDVTQGSPFDTGTANALTSFLLNTTLIGYLRHSATPSPLGVIHGGDIDEFAGVGNGTDFIGADALIYFTRNLDPNPPADEKPAPER
ncbi:unnamed protein product [Cyclocybe aegerita]|uniref:Carboxylesterase type B domain-containing protein n=1 Tax=Cyclocybe aegerita TaxID=1973307 RepID=A0A8S0XH40_CYCAE|nr:unnamed protein product [Cyclocybe aegerita]